MAVWCEKRSSEVETRVELHFNLWRFGCKKRDDLLEVGVMLDNPRDIECIKIYFPSAVLLSDISDCGPSFDQGKTAQAIFNEPLSRVAQPGQKCIELLKDNVPFCDVHCFTLENGHIDAAELSIEGADGGSIVSIKAGALHCLATQKSRDARGYFRLRVRLAAGSAHPYVKSIEPSDKFWTSSIDHIEYVDFRLNEARTLPVKVAEQMKSAAAGIAKVKLVAFLTAVPVVSAVASSHEAWRKSRLLEHDVWKSYVKDGVPDGMVVYHWREDAKEDGNIENFSAFVKLQTRKSGGKILFTYVMVAFVFGVLGNLTASRMEKPLLDLSSWAWAEVMSIEVPADKEKASPLQGKPLFAPAMEATK